MKLDDEYGLLIDRSNNYGTEYVTVHVVRRDGDNVLGCSGDGEIHAGYGCPKHLLGLVLDGLGIYGFISEYAPINLIGDDVEFQNVHAMNERKLGRMAKAIRRVKAQIEKDQSREPGDKFMSFAKALKLSFAVKRIGQHRSPPNWHFMPLEEGRNHYRHMIENAVAEVSARKSA